MFVIFSGITGTQVVVPTVTGVGAGVVGLSFVTTDVVTPGRGLEQSTGHGSKMWIRYSLSCYHVPFLLWSHIGPIPI